MIALTAAQWSSLIVCAVCVVVFAVWIVRLLLILDPTPKPEIVKPSRPLMGPGRWNGNGWRTGR
jgi:hypothetical protein